MKIKKSYIIGGLVVAGAVVMAMFSFKSTLTAYVTISEAKTTQRPVQVAGVPVKNSARYDQQTKHLVFTLREEAGDEIVVEYAGLRPSNFDDATKVVAIGKFDPNKQTFAARELLVKCPTKYDATAKKGQGGKG